MPTTKNLSCSQCGRAMWDSKTSLPQGEATCLACRRAKKGAAPKFEPELRTCQTCKSVYEAHRKTQRYCNPECRPSGFARKQGQQSARDRGYGAAHQRERNKWAPIVASGQAVCCICGTGIHPRQKWHLDHTPDRSGYRGVAHASCNMRDGASRGAKRSNGGRQYQRACSTCGVAFSTAYPKQRYCSKVCAPTRRAAASKPTQQRLCEHCGVQIRQGKLCGACRSVVNRDLSRELMRNAYRSKVGIPLDAPLYSRARRPA